MSGFKAGDRIVNMWDGGTTIHFGKGPSWQSRKVYGPVRGIVVAVPNSEDIDVLIEKYSELGVAYGFRSDVWRLDPDYNPSDELKERAMRYIMAIAAGVADHD